jgi:hypothetical protein
LLAAAAWLLLGGAAWSVFAAPDIDVRASDSASGLLVPEGGPNPAPVSIRVRNRGACPLALTATAFTTDGAPWLSVSPTEAELGPAASTELTLSFEVVTTALVPGNYVGTVRLAGTCVNTGRDARGSPRTVSVNLRVIPVAASLVVDTSRVEVDVTELVDQWLPMAENTLYPGRSSHTAIWTGYEMWVFGGLDLVLSTLGRGGKYDPITDEWSPMPANLLDAPGLGPRYLHTAVWTGTEMIIWGGQTDTSTSSVVDTGGRLGETWTTVSTSGAPTARANHTAVWTGTEMIVFGGSDDTGAALDTGGRYNPATDTWIPLPTTGAPSPRLGHAAVWTGRFMLVWGGEDGSGNMRASGRRYDPVADRWTPMAEGGPVRSYPISAWTGSRWILYGGVDGPNTFSDGAMYLLGEDRWVEMAPDSQRRADLTSSVWTGRELIVWGGISGRRFDPVTNTWSDVTSVGQPSIRQAASAIWTGTEMIVWGGTGALSDGAIYR